MTVPEKNTARLKIGVGLVFLIALILGPGPGSTLIDGSAEAPHQLFGVPALYCWLVFWWLVMAGCVVTAARCLWREDD
jgi:hypothetical protein